ncbi:MAG: cysteine--tRNA ligase [Bernardetiaceae bacterium]
MSHQKYSPLRIQNNLTRRKENFQPLHPHSIGMYVCGPTVYNYVHLGNCRTFTAFDLVRRYLMHLGYRVRYVRNITDVGHLTDENEDRISRAAKLQELEPMEIVQRYTNDFHRVMAQLNNLPPDIEPTATGHIPEQIQMIETLLKKGWAYRSEGSVYFDVRRYDEAHTYGLLSGRVLEELQAGSRQLDGQDEKRHPADFALWKKAAPEHIMRWHSPWSVGFPGWHLECSVMSSKYLGEQFDIHGGGMDLQFPHHECEIAQCTAANDTPPVRYWMHSNMLTINGQKMSKSLNNSILPAQLFTGDHPLLDQPYSPMVFRFFMLQTHYASTMDISTEALQAAKKAYRKLMNGLRALQSLVYPEKPDTSPDPKTIALVQRNIEALYHGMNDDFNTAKALAAVFNLLKKINAFHIGQAEVSSLDTQTFEMLQQTLPTFVQDVLGLQDEQPNAAPLLDALLEVYREAKTNKDYARVDALRAQAKQAGIVFKDLKEKIDWAYEE